MWFTSEEAKKKKVNVGIKTVEKQWSIQSVLEESS